MDFIADLEPYLLRRWLDGDDSVLGELVEGFWDRQYLRKHGFPRIPGVKWPPVPLPDPPPIDFGGLQNEVLANVVGWLSNDPDPEPNQPVQTARGRNLLPALANRKLRLSAATALRERILKSLKGLEAEITRLSK